jgi:protease-4
MVDALEFAKNDDRIGAVHLELSSLGFGGLSKLQRIGAALEDFKESGKTIVASADYFSQPGYYLAAHADELYMHPEGILFLQGYGSFRSYYKEAIDLLRIDWNVFRVGTHKSYVEPYTRMDMSPEDRESRSRLINQFWSMYQEGVEAARDLPAGAIDDFVQNLVAKVTAVGGDLAEATVDSGLVDQLMSRAEIRSVLKGYVGEDKKDNTTYSSVHMSDYLKHMRLTSGSDASDENIAVIVAVGTILNGSHSPGSIGGDSTAALLRRALRDDSVKAVVLRVDSPGGSVFASEVIAHEIETLQTAGKPVVASMSSVAASGGYWISVVADKVIASPATITGSIGVFSMLPTYQRTLRAVGIASDGVGTTPWSGQLRPDREMSTDTKQLIQLLVNDTYDDFISGVAELRDMDKQAVDLIGQGQVWTGVDALENGLIDELGSFEDAIRAAAELAELEEGEYGKKQIKTELSPSKQMVLDFLALAKGVGIDPASLVGKPTIIQSFANRLQKLLAQVTQFNDPKGVYLHCFCEID